MIKIIFICSGNICRSPMAVAVFNELAKAKGLSDRFEVTSAGLLFDTGGQDIYPQAKAILSKHNIPYGPHVAHKVRYKDFSACDYVICMEEYNAVLLIRDFQLKDRSKIHLLLDYADSYLDKDIGDPYETKDFKTAFQEILEGCDGLLKYLESKESSA